MKQIIVIIVVMAFTNNVIAQRDSLKISVGIALAPQAGISLSNPKEGFNTFIPISLVFPIVKGKTVIIPQYNFSTNSCAILISQDLSSTLSAYIVGSESVINKGGYVGFGFTKVINKYSLMFAELGTGTQAWGPEFYIGVLLPFTLRINK